MGSPVRDGRAFRLEADARVYWAGAGTGEWVHAGGKLQLNAVPEDSLRLRTVRGWMEASGPLTARALAGTLGFPVEDTAAALVQLERDGQVLRGLFSGIEEEFCDRRILARIHRATIAHLRREIEPVSSSMFLKHLLEWQHLADGAQLTGEQGVLEVVDQLQGFETAGVAWEDEILRKRVADYQPAFLDNLCLGGDIVWGNWETSHDAGRKCRRGARPHAQRAARSGFARGSALGCSTRCLPTNRHCLRPHGMSWISCAAAALLFRGDRFCNTAPGVRSGRRALAACGCRFGNGRFLHSASSSGNRRNQENGTLPPAQATAAADPHRAMVAS